GVDDPVPTDLAQHRDHEHRPAQPRDERTLQQHDLRDAREQEAGVQRDHEREMPPAVLAPTAREGGRGVALGDDELEDALTPGQEDERDVERDAQAHDGHSSSTNSALTPGPSANSRPCAPGAGSVAASTWSTAADERLPTCSSE